MTERSAEERERARLEREARRQAREGGRPAQRTGDHGGGGLFGRVKNALGARDEEIGSAETPPPEPEPRKPEVGSPTPAEPVGPAPPVVEPQRRLRRKRDSDETEQPRENRVRRVPPEAREWPGAQPPPEAELSEGWRPPRKRTTAELRERVKARAAQARLGRIPAPGAPRPAKPRKGGRPRALALVVPGLLVLAVLWFLWSAFQPFHGEGSGKLQVTVPPKSGVGEVADVLEKKGVISSAFFFQVRATVGGDRGGLKSGSYTLKKDMSYSEATDALRQGPGAGATFQVTIPEGKARSEVAGIARETGVKGSYAKASIKSPRLNPRRYGAHGAKNLEGFLFPSTYELKRHATAKMLVNKQLANFKTQWGKVGLSYARRKHLTPYDVLIIASMIDREAQLDKERALIASVIYNRLSDGIPLGIDATIRFATNNWAQPLTESDLKISSRYNTRTRKGLPPGPIGSPGLESIRAAAHPRRTRLLYYVVKPGTCGEHAFSKTFEQFQRDARRYASARALKGGRSPTNCK